MRNVGFCPTTQGSMAIPTVHHVLARSERPLMQKHSSERVHYPPEVAILDRVSLHVLHSNMMLISQLLQCTLFNIAAA